jgi:Terminase large subunit, ATPase domain
MPVLGIRTLKRYRAEPTAFITEVLRNPETGQPFVLLPAEIEFLKHALRTGPNGRLLYPQLIYACPKKSGKTVFGAIFIITLIVLLGSRYAEAYSAANDYEQAQSRVFEMCRRIIEASPLLRSEAEILAHKITFPATGATITVLASDYASAAGGHPCVSVFDELWAYTSERSRRLWDELIPVPTKKISCRLVVSHAGFEGESVLLQELYQRGLAQPQVGPDLYAGDGLLMFWSHEPVAPWQDAAWLAEMHRDLRPHQFIRMVENQFTSGDTGFIDMNDFDRCVDPALTPPVADPKLPIFVGIDASVKHDSTAIVATTWDEESRKVGLVAHRIFQPSAKEPLDFEASIEETLRDLKQRFAIRKVLYDPYQIQATAQRLARAGIRIEEFPQSLPNITNASQNLYELISGHNITLYADRVIRLAMTRAIAVETARGWKIAKEKQAHKIDVVVALGMSALAAVQSAIKVPQEIPMVGCSWWSPSTGWVEPGRSAQIDTSRPGSASFRATPPPHYLSGGQGGDERWRQFTTPRYDRWSNRQ